VTVNQAGMARKMITVSSQSCHSLTAIKPIYSCLRIFRRFQKFIARRRNEPDDHTIADGDVLNRSQAIVMARLLDVST
jgi:hypothetical protein